MTNAPASERFGTPQIAAAILLLAFAAQCAWFIARAPLTPREEAFVAQGLRQRQGGEISFHEQASPITGLVASLPVLRNTSLPDPLPPAWRWLPRIPFIAIGMLLGGSLWYVARRLYGNVAGYAALMLYAFSPTMIIRAATVQPLIIAAWGAFGVIFTAIGVAHTLYAPREVVLWNWRRILLLGTALGMALAAQLGVVVLLPVALAFMLYLVPERRGATVVIIAAAGAIGFAVLLLAYGWHMGALADAARATHVFDFVPRMYSLRISYTLLGHFFLAEPTVALLLAASLITFAIWKRARFFGTLSPLVVFVVLIVLGIGMPHQGLGFYVVAMPFAFVFIAGVFADLLESKLAPVALGVLMGVLIGQVILSVHGLLEM